MINDFGHGMIDEGWSLSAASRGSGGHAQTNSANRGYNLITKYPRADFICIDEPEARGSSRALCADETVVREALKSIDCHFRDHARQVGSIVYTPQAGVKRIRP